MCKHRLYSYLRLTKRVENDYGTNIKEAKQERIQENSMKLTIPGLCFLTSSIPLKFNTDGHDTLFKPMSDDPCASENVLVLTNIHVQMLQLQSVNGISLFDHLDLNDDFVIPEIYDGSQNLGGKSILILMLNGWGDMILIQPALQAFYKKAASSGKSPHITLGCNWIHNFPYPNVPFIQDVRPNILTLKELGGFDLLVNLIPVNHKRSLDKSMKDLCFEILKLNGEKQDIPAPFIAPDLNRVAHIQPAFDRLRKSTGKKLCYVNWKSRFVHKNAPPQLLFKIVETLSDQYQAVLFKDAPVAKIMQKEIDASNSSVKNLSHLINDYHDTIAALSLVDAFISVDTGIVHAAGAMGIPGVALFGPFPPETHVSDYPSIIGIRGQYEGKICKGPCLETHRGCAELNFLPASESPCFKSIKADDVIEAFKKALNGI